MSILLKSQNIYIVCLFVARKPLQHIYNHIKKVRVKSLSFHSSKSMSAVDKLYIGIYD